MQGVVPTMMPKLRHTQEGKLQVVLAYQLTVWMTLCLWVWGYQRAGYTQRALPLATFVAQVNGIVWLELKSMQTGLC